MSFLDIFAYTVVISRETVKSPKNTIFDTCAQNSGRYEFCDLFTHTVRISRKWSDHIGTRFVILVYRSRGVMSFLTFLLI